jgi:hypothetical protein
MSSVDAAWDCIPQFQSLETLAKHSKIQPARDSLTGNLDPFTTAQDAA